MDETDAEGEHAPLIDATAFGPIFDQHYDRIWSFLHQRGGRECADELAGEVFATALANRRRFDPARGDVQAWIYGIAANLARAWLRRRGRGRRAISRITSLTRVAADLEVDDAVDRVDARLSGASDAARVVAALGRLPDADQEILILFAWQGLSYEEIAEVLHVAVGTVRSRLSRARRRLRELSEVGDQVVGIDPMQEPR